ncbi:MAG: outer membrane protein assembly factor BamA, partial [Desulfobacterales bacterium]|nr:outer membrane protein assembly factor BamA [Desulfobacterales bacterium]
MSRWIWIPTLLCLALCGPLKPKIVKAEERGKVAVLPFRVYAPKSFDHLTRGLQKTLTLSLEKRGFKIISPEAVNEHPLAFLPILDMRTLVEVGEDLKADWIIAGSLTQIGRKVSIDLKVVDVSEKRDPFSLFMVAEDVDALKETVERIALNIDNHIVWVVQVDSIDVEGNQRIEKEAILAVIRTKKGDRLDYEQLDKDLRDIYKMGFFKDVKIETEEGPTGTTVTLHVTEKPSIGKIVIQGNKKQKEEKLKEELGIKLYSIFNQNEVKQSVNRLREYYSQKGYYNVDIKEKIEPLPNNQVLVRYEITENEKVYIRKIKFVGNHEFDDDDLQDVMEISEKGFLSWFTKSGVLDKKKLEFDVHKITSFYHNKGFIKAKVGEPKISYEKEKGITITIEIHEGPQYHVGKVAIEGDLVKPADDLLKEVQIGQEKTFNRETVRKDVQALRSIYADEGYAHAEVTPVTKEDSEAHLMDITYTISKRQKVRFARVNISGNTVTRDKVIRREIKVIEGDYFSAKRLRRSTGNIQRLGFFEDVQIQTKKGSTEDLMVLDVNVKERSTGQFSIGAGYSSEDSAFGVFQISQNNLFGRGQRLQASAKIGGISRAFDISFLEPWLFDKPVSGGIDVYNRSREYNEYTRDALGGDLLFGFPLPIDEFTRGTVKYGYDDTDISKVPEDAALEIKEMEGQNVTSSMTFAITRDSRDKLWDTSKGSYNRLRFEYAGGVLGGDIGFNKYIAKTGWYFPLFWDTVFLVNGTWGFVVQRTGEELPVYQKFSIGGIQTVRGFEYESISPRDPETGDRIGGEKMMYYNVEFRFPLAKEQGVVGVVFFDAGNVFTKDETYTFNGIRTSAGGGIRWYSP